MPQKFDTRDIVVMKRIVLVLSLVFLIASCQKKEEPQLSDTLLSHPISPVDTSARFSHDTTTGLVVDSSRMRSPEHLKLLARFTPVEVVRIYHDYRPLRAGKPSAGDIQAFQTSHKISHDELLAILDEGDRLGWNTPQ